MDSGTKTRHPLFARLYERVARAAEPLGAGAHREALLAGLSGRVIEVGAGSGVTFRHYPATVAEVVAVEPEPYLRERAAEAAGRAPVSITVVDGVADELPGADGEFDSAVVSLVLCSVPDQAAALGELHRVLRPGGELRFYEHVLADDPRLARLQRAIDVAWPKLAAGWHTSRDTVGAIAGRRLRGRVPRPIRVPAVPAGRARRPPRRGSGPQAVAPPTRCRGREGAPTARSSTLVVTHGSLPPREEPPMKAKILVVVVVLAAVAAGYGLGRGDDDTSDVAAGASAKHTHTTGSAATDTAPPTAIPGAEHVHAVTHVPDGGLLLGAHTGLFRSDDGGATWEEVELQGDVAATDFMSLVAHPTQPATLFAGGHGLGVVRSDDGGRSWTRSDEGIEGTDIHALTINPRDPDYLYAFSVGHGVFRSTDGGAIWQRIDDGPENDAVRSFAYSAVQTDMDRSMGSDNWGLLLAGTADGVYESYSCFCGWRATTDALAGSTVYTLAVPHDDAETIHAGTADGVWRTTDAGETWAPLHSLDADGRVAAIAIDPDDSNRLTVATETGRIHGSEDGGESWTTQN